MKSQQDLRNEKLAIMREMTQCVIAQSDLDLRLKHLEHRLAQIEKVLEARNAIKE